MKHHSLVTTTTLIASLLITCSKGFAQNGLPIETAQPTRLTVAPTASSPIPMKTLPQAICSLHAEGVSDAEQSLKISSDEEGMIRFHVHPSGNIDQIARFEVDCEANGKVTKFPLELRSSSSPTADMPAPEVEIPAPPEERVKSQPGASVRPALTDDDAMNLAPEELARRGYPARPDPAQSAKIFATWLDAVTKPATFVPPRLVAHPSVSHSPKVTNNYGSANWSGWELRTGLSPFYPTNGGFNQVTASWYVPNVSQLYEYNRHNYSAFWIGLDGDGTSDLWQAGTEQEMISIGGWTFSYYYAWTEFLPLQSVEQVIYNFAVWAGDQMYASVSIGNPYQAPSLYGAYAIATVENLSRREYTTIYQPRTGVFIPGYSAEWIMERPSVNNALPDLADYGTVDPFWDSACAQDWWVNLYGCPSHYGGTQIFMYNGYDLLSGIEPGSLLLPFPHLRWYRFN